VRKSVFKLNGKQGYGPARGIWQTPYLEARGQSALASIHFSPDIDREKVSVTASLLNPVPADMRLSLKFNTGGLARPVVIQQIAKGEKKIQFEVSIPKPHLWSLDDPFLYELTVSLSDDGIERDRVHTYFGMRKIGVVNLPGTDHPYIALNNKPIYLQLALDQAYHPDGFYTFPSDDFMRDEILRSRRIGLNGMRVHVKISIPRKLYWADRLGMLIMADVPNSWGAPDADMRGEIDYALRSMIQRDFNHPSIFSWIVFNETWGLKTDDKYLPETQKWVASMYRLAKSLDPTRLVEDNSPCLYDHVETDINTWHAYRPGYKWRSELDQVSRDTFPGSEWNFVKDYKQSGQPLLNSECGNVWGYDGSTGDVDWSWDYHIMMNEMRRHPKICGWLYTEHHDVINEWNGYFRFDRSEKFTGMNGLAPGMNLRDLHAPFYIALGDELCQKVKPGETVSVPLFASFMTDRAAGDSLRLRSEFYGWDTLGRRETYARSTVNVPFKPWMAEAMTPMEVKMPLRPALAVLSVALEDTVGNTLHRNFTTFLIAEKSAPRTETRIVDGKKIRVVRVAPKRFTQSDWSQKQWNVMDGLKVNGAGSGYFEYRIPWPDGLNVEDIAEATFRVEASAKKLFGKDRDGAKKVEGDFMLGKGTHDPSLNPNSYPMTDERRFPSSVSVQVAGQSIGQFDLPDDPADHQGILSWYSQKRDNKLREAGSYGYLLSAAIPPSVLKRAKAENAIVLRLEADDSLAGGLAIYGERFGRYPLDPTFVFVMK